MRQLWRHERLLVTVEPGLLSARHNDHESGNTRSMCSVASHPILPTAECSPGTSFSFRNPSGFLPCLLTRHVKENGKGQAPDCSNQAARRVQG